MSTQRPTMPSHRGFSSATPLLGILAGLALVVVIVLLAIGESSWAIPVAILALLVGAVGLVDAFVARRKMLAHGGSTEALESDARDSVPIQAQTGDTPLGASTEEHEDITPHDIPAGNPAREELERRREGPPAEAPPPAESGRFERSG